MAAAVALVLLSLADLTLTRVIIDRFGGIEANPVWGEALHTNVAWWIKGGFVAFVAAIVIWKVRSRWVANLWYGVATLYALVVLYQIGLIVYVSQ